MTKVTAQARHKQSREAALEEMSLLFRRLRKVDREGADVTCCGRPFHTCAASSSQMQKNITDLIMIKVTNHNKRTNLTVCYTLLKRHENLSRSIMTTIEFGHFERLLKAFLFGETAAH